MVRVRFAPSPTGELHLGGARTALYNYLFARQQQGAFIIRIEDTDQERLVPGALNRMLDGLRWLGLSWDEGPDVGGSQGPYVQSERLDIYHKQVDALVQTGAAYPCFCSTARLDILRQVQSADGQPTRYDGLCRKLTPQEAATKISAHEPHVVRLKVPTEGSTVFTDLVRGQIEVKNADIDDQVLMKTDGYPTYHLANVVDDHLMSISHVIRGEEWLPSTPKHILLYGAFGWQAPEFAHLPNVLNQNRAKLSKRKDGELVWQSTYQQQGYLAPALANYLALLGWHPKDDREVFSLPELEQTFELRRVQKAGAIFSLDKLKWFNAQYIKLLPLSALDKLLQPYYAELAGGSEFRPTTPLTELLQSRLVTLAEAKEHSTWFFKHELELAPELLIPKQGNLATTAHALAQSRLVLAKVGEWRVDEIKNVLEVLIRPGTLTRGELLWPVRVALTGERQSPDVYGVAWALGRDITLRRLDRASAVLSHAAT